MHSLLVCFLLGKGDRYFRCSGRHVPAHSTVKASGASHWSGRRDSNPHRPAWKAGVLAIGLLPHEPTFTESETAPNEFVELACREQVPRIWYPQAELNRPRNT